ncbi:alkaline phosphatase D family protein [Streptomyces durbertensis]|uniref:Alkaline phosphatase D family protein n=1 Tax=Streptomyces durbertensis TaxID=2448886 RepID=A0ABR6EJW3_9ACTN|nr:alkaline phosphatase D family protein [Streptomyces durbertensis]MBB1245620.1 alkaline phosphatase D family protein [Streptomyces durbertensis]
MTPPPTHQVDATPPLRSTPRRRAVIAAAGGAALVPLVASAATASRASASTTEAPAFLHGVASGDPLPDGVLLWTRVTPEPGATPGSGRGGRVEVRWEVSLQRNFGTLAAHGRVTTDAASDHTVKADVRGLTPGTEYHYRFTVDGVTSPVGRTRTTPADATSPDRLRLGVVSCSNWEAGHFAAYRHLADRTDLDAVLHLGDYLYEYGAGEYGTRGRSVRRHEPAHEMVSLADYRTRHGQYKTDPHLRAMHAAHPVIAVWDDHELANDAWSGGAENHQPETEGHWADRVAAAKKAYFEWMPVRTSVAGTTYRGLRFGALADLHLLDLRSFRDQQAKPGSGEVDSPNRTMTGRAQLDWLKSGLAAPGAHWRLVGTSVMISPMAFGSLPAYLLRPLAKLLGVPAGGLAVNTDQWDGYAHDRAELLDHLRRNGVSNTVFLAGDLHMNWANEVPVNAATYPLSKSVATEFVVTSVTSDNLDDYLRVKEGTITPVVSPPLRAANRHAKWVDVDRHGYGVLHLDREKAQMDFFAVSDKTDAAATSRHLRSYRTASGSNRLERVSEPQR